MKKVLLAIAFLFQFSANALELLRIYNHETIADTQRYNDIKSLLDKYNRPFTILMLGNDCRQMLFNIAGDFPAATCVYIDADRSNYTLRRCIREKRENIVFIKKTINSFELKKLSECEHFDVTIALNFVRLSTKKTIDHLLHMGDYLITNSYNKADIPMRNLACLLKKKPKISSSKSLWYIKTNNEHLLRNNWKRRDLVNPEKYFIESTFEKKALIKEKKGNVIRSAWIPGINMETFCHLHGGFPQKETVKRSIDKLLRESNRPNHISFHNMVIQGEKIMFIDIGKKYTNFSSEDKKKFKQLIKRLDYDLKY